MLAALLQQSHAAPLSVLVNAAMAGWRRSLFRQRRRVGPMLPTAIPSLSLISAYGTGGSSISKRINCWPDSGRSCNASHSAAWRSAASSSCSAVPACSIREGLDVHYVPARQGSPRRASDAEAFSPGHGGQPARKRGRIPDLVQVVHQLQPDALADVLGVGVAEPVPAADRPDQRGVPLDERVPRLLVAVSGASHQVNDHRVIEQRISARSRRRAAAAAGEPAAPVPLGGMRDRSRAPFLVGLCRGAAYLSGHDLVLLPARNGPGTSGRRLVPPWPQGLVITTRAGPQEETQDQPQNCAGYRRC